ncbi:MAG TPA: hypothetical protein VET90_01055 [Candidatus Binatus sp.]|nr:hypothetical protein [Candidatus Binatus sp.]
MTNPPFRTEVRRLLGASAADAGASVPAWRPAPPCDDGSVIAEVGAVVAQLDPIRSRSSLLSSYAREASPSEPVRTAYAIRWVELGRGVAATGVARARRGRVMQPGLRRRG